MKFANGDYSTEDWVWVFMERKREFVGTAKVNGYHATASTSQTADAESTAEPTRKNN